MDRATELLAVFMLWEISLVVSLTLIVMILMKPRGAIEWATVGKEVAFTAIMAASIYRVITQALLSPEQALALYAVCAVLLTTYLGVFLWQWFAPAFLFVWRCCVKWWPVVAIIVGDLILIALLILR